ncbi:type IV pilus twitching motility protein PilT [Meiothermus sp.]|uniref:type IV pilus twitching motility protein PilT n=1 Tax=Meiothermus sp. TaxID=1955249 RepID=UPI0021DBC165|nr:PilT/PilU family type 4a pilus ATPase [Meiothermus sp.]GIW33446.1 MAG: twitching motility protein PilT [Meiothermus sp.]
MHFEEMLTLLVHKGASDIHLHAGMPVLARIGGELRTITQSAITPEFTTSLVEKLCTPQQQARLHTFRQVDVAYSLPGLTRLRVNLFYQRGSISAVLHTLSSEDKDLSKVSLDAAYLEFFRDQRRGLVLVTGPIGAGKSTTLARLVDEINTHHTRVIVTVEDPIEYLHRPKRSAVIQREIGSDAVSYEKALLAAMRQNADVIVIGEIRDPATASAVLNAVYTGHLVLSTFVSSDSSSVLNRMLELFSQGERNINRVLLAESLLGIIHQRLVPTTDGERVPVTEVITMTPRIREALKQPSQTDRLREVLREQGLEGYQSFDENLLSLYNKGRVDYQTARLYAQNPTQFELAILRQSDNQGFGDWADE